MHPCCVLGDLYTSKSLCFKHFQGSTQPECILGVIWKHGNLKAATNAETSEQSFGEAQKSLSGPGLLWYV